MPSAQVALEEAKLRFAVHLRTIDDKHPLTNRTTLPLVIRGRAAGNRRIPRSKVQRVAQLLPATPRNVLASPHFSDGSRQDPTQGQGKDIAAQNFTIWWESLGQETITVFSDGSEQQINGTRVVTYGYAIYQGQAAVATGQGSLNALSHVFDAEAIGACRGLKHALQLSLPSQREIVLCIDSTSVIWGIRGTAPTSSQWAFLQIHGAMEAYNVKTRWAPGHMKIVGNELADQLADSEAKDPHQPYGMAASPTRSGIRTVGRRLLEHTRDTWWQDKSSRLSAWYTQWQLPYDTRRTPAALWLPRRILAKVLMIRSTHGDFEWYHRKFNHEDTSKCLCGRPKTPEHLVFCKRATTHFKKWPLRPIVPPRTRQEGLAYLAQLIDQPQEFETFVKTLLWGKGSAASFDNDVQELTDEHDFIEEWRRVGPLGVLLSMINYIKTRQQHKLFEDFQRLAHTELPSSASADDGKILEPVKPVVTRWNSYYLCFERAVKLQFAVNDYATHHIQRVQREDTFAQSRGNKLPVAQPWMQSDGLTGADWAVITEYIHKKRLRQDF
ncbi:hypothetical protein L13192_07952 [Pyrenophora tritici-repentis]|nr:hypothetical protein L13192_07952 [Pyrenophora tritici-repentis]